MPPRLPVLQAQSPTPPPAIAINDQQDLLIIQDLMDTLDQLPPELTRVHSDLNELGAVLYSTQLNLEKKLDALVNMLQDDSCPPEKRFELLQEIGEEAARYKLGGDDKIRVSGGACDGIAKHQLHISDLLNASTLLVRGPPSPYSQSITLPHIPIATSSRRAIARAANSPFSGRGGAVLDALAGGGTPTKKKRSRVAQLGREDDESSVGGEKRKGPVKKRRPAQRAVSPSDSIGSSSAFIGRPTQPQTARQLAAAANRARKAEQVEDSDGDSQDEGSSRKAPRPPASLEGPAVAAAGLGLDVGSREGSRSANATPANGNGNGNGSGNGRSGRRGTKRGREDEEEEDEEEDGEDDQKKNGRKVVAAGELDLDGEMEGGEVGGDGDIDSKLYCVCQQPSYGEMIGCDNDDCPIEWYHLACLGMEKTPEGTWLCPQCVEMKRQQKAKRAQKKGKK